MNPKGIVKKVSFSAFGGAVAGIIGEAVPDMLRKVKANKLEKGITHMIYFFFYSTINFDRMVYKRTRT